MTNSQDGDRYTSYLLGESPEGERDALEEAFFSDDDVYQELKAAEDDLIDAYAANRLSPERRARFEARYLATPEGRGRVQFAHALKQGADSALGREPRALRVVSQPRYGWAAALAVLALGASLFASLRLGRELGRLRSEKAVLERTASEQERRVSEQERRLTALAEELQQLRAQSQRLQEQIDMPRAAARVAALVLSRGLSRGAESVPRLVLAPGIDRVALTLPLDAASPASHRASLQTVEGHELWSRTGLRPVPAPAGTALVITVPAKVLQHGHHLVLVSRADGPASELVAEYVFMVARQRQ